MLEWLQEWMLPDRYMPHGYCYLWESGLVSLHVLSDAFIALAYYSIPITLIYFVRKRSDLPFHQIFLMFGTFIIACGTTHLMAVLTLWFSAYWVAGALKALTAVVSVFTAIELVSVVPLALALPSPTQLAIAKQELEAEIAERTKVEDALRQSEARYRAIVEDQTEFICRFRADSTIVFVNNAYCRFFNVRKEEVIGNSYEPTVYESDRTRVNQVIESISSERSVVQIENRVVVDGEIRWTQWVSRGFFDEQGQLLELQAVGRDITEQKRVEAELERNQQFVQKVANTAPFILYVCTVPNQRLIYINRGIYSLLGYSPNEFQPLGTRSLESLLHPDDQADLVVHHQKWGALQDGDSLQFECRMQHINGEWRYISIQETTFKRNRDGSINQILGAAHDISDRKELEAYKVLLREKDILLEEVHHRVKNNLQIIDSLLSLQCRQTKDSDAIATLTESRNRISSIALVHEKLYRSNDLATIDFNDYVYSLLNHLYEFYQNNQQMIQFEIMIEPLELGIDTAIPCGLIINELITNALKYAFPQQQRGTIGVTFQAVDAHQLKLVVQDDGIGLPDDLDVETTSSLGLNLVYNLVEQLEGTLVIRHHPGAQFTITFPKPSST